MIIKVPRDKLVSGDTSETREMELTTYQEGALDGLQSLQVDCLFPARSDIHLQCTHRTNELVNKNEMKRNKQFTQCDFDSP